MVQMCLVDHPSAPSLGTMAQQYLFNNITKKLQHGFHVLTVCCVSTEARKEAMYFTYFFKVVRSQYGQADTTPKGPERRDHAIGMKTCG